MRPQPHLLILWSLSILCALAQPLYAQDSTTPKRTTKPSKKRPKPVEGIVVQVQNGEIVVDLGRSDGLVTGGEVQLYRRLEVTHPVTQKKVVDRFPSGALIVDDVGERLSISRQRDGFKTPPKEGDIVVLYPTPPSEPTTPETPSPQPTKDPLQAEVEATFAKTLGKPLPERIALWESIIKRHPKSPYIDNIGREVVWLRLKLAEERSTAQRLESIKAKRIQDAKNPLLVRVSAVSAVGDDKTFALSAAVTRPELVQTVRVLMRERGAVQYDTLPMKRRGDFLWSLELGNGERAHALSVGDWEYFVEVVRTSGELMPVRGDAQKPARMSIQKTVPNPTPTVQRSLARMRFDYVDFKIGEGVDQYTRFETDYRYRVNSMFLETVRVGVGIFEGTATPVASIERGSSEGAITKTTAYGFAEGEIPLGPWVGLSARVLLGNQSTDKRDTLRSALGFRSELRLGELDRTHLRIGGSLTEGLGNEAWLHLWVDTIDRIPMLGEATVTNLPSNGDLGVMLNYGVGYAITPWLTPMLRVGWNARTINHQGATAGLDVQIAW